MVSPNKDKKPSWTIHEECYEVSKSCQISAISFCSYFTIPYYRPNKHCRYIIWMICKNHYCWVAVNKFPYTTLQWRHNIRDGVPIISVSIVFTAVCAGTDQIKHQSSTSLDFARGIHRGSGNFQHKGPVTRKISQFDDVVMTHGPVFW